ISESRNVPDRRTAKEKCYSLAGDYIRHRDARYVFTSDEFTRRTGITATAIDWSWENVQCKSGEIVDAPSDTFALIGEDSSTHRIEIRMEDGDYKHVADATAKYLSYVIIDRDGEFGERRILHSIGELNAKYIQQEYVTRFEKKIALYDEERKRIHNQISKGNPCVAAIGSDNSIPVLAFACKNYTRTLIRIKK
ncbi:MAG: hypothetical protein Q7T85_12690, partial [Nitrosomonas sp.]|nr:hypothetical protein [Nitrosomonas sp.]